MKVIKLELAARIHEEEVCLIATSRVRERLIGIGCSKLNVSEKVSSSPKHVDGFQDGGCGFWEPGCEVVPLEGISSSKRISGCYLDEILPSDRDGPECLIEGGRESDVHSHGNRLDRQRVSIEVEEVELKGEGLNSRHQIGEVQSDVDNIFRSPRPK